MTKQKVKELVPLVLVVGALIYTALTALIGDTVFDSRLWAAYGFTSVVIVTYFVHKILSNILLGLTLVLGVFHVLVFTPYFFTVGGGLGEAILEFQLLPLLALLAFLYAHHRGIRDWINKDGL